MRAMTSEEMGRAPVKGTSVLFEYERTPLKDWLKGRLHHGQGKKGGGEKRTESAGKKALESNNYLHECNNGELGAETKAFITIGGRSQRGKENWRGGGGRRSRGEPPAHNKRCDVAGGRRMPRAYGTPRGMWDANRDGEEKVWNELDR